MKIEYGSKQYKPGDIVVLKTVDQLRNMYRGILGKDFHILGCNIGIGISRSMLNNLGAELIISGYHHASGNYTIDGNVWEDWMISHKVRSIYG